MSDVTRRTNEKNGYIKMLFFRGVAGYKMNHSKRNEDIRRGLRKTGWTMSMFVLKTC
jgi:hypothetical protein